MSQGSTIATVVTRKFTGKVEKKEADFMIPARSIDITADWLNEVLHTSGFLRDANIESITH